MQTEKKKKKSIIIFLNIGKSAHIRFQYFFILILKLKVYTIFFKKQLIKI